MTAQAKPTTVTCPEPTGQVDPPVDALTTTGMRTSCGSAGAFTTNAPLEPSDAMSPTLRQTAMRLTRPWPVGPAFWPVLVATACPMATQGTYSPSISPA